MTTPRILTLTFMALAALLLAACRSSGPESPLPAAPGNVQAIPGDGFITITWEDRSANETRFVVYRAVATDDAEPNFEAIATKEANTTSHTDEGVVANERYLYAVAAKNAVGESQMVALAEPVQTAPAAGEVRVVVEYALDSRGSGTITSEDGGINCSEDGGDCAQNYPEGTSLTLTASARPGSAFEGWSGEACSGSSATCSFVVSSSLDENGDRTITILVTFEQTAYGLVVQKEKNNGGDGILEAAPNSTYPSPQPGRLRCDLECSETSALYIIPPEGTQATTVGFFEPDVAEGSLFEGWGGDCSGTGCSVVMSEDRDVIAYFTKPKGDRYRLEGVADRVEKSAAEGVLANDGQLADNGFTAKVVEGSGPQYGELDLNPDGSFTYTYVTLSDDSFVYEVTDRLGNKAQATVMFNLNNDAPTAEDDDSYTVNEDSTLDEPAPGVLANDSDPDGDPLMAKLKTDVQHGTLDLNEDGSFTYTPDANYSGTDSFTYTATDGLAESNEATVTITVEALPRYTLSVAKEGEGSGTVTSVPGGINCGTSCEADFKQGTSVQLSANPAADSEFVEWGGACSGATCTVTMDAAKTVTATFRKKPVLSVSVAGQGSVSSDPAGINDCETDCTASFATDGRVELTALPASGWNFTGWGGACSGTDTTCTVTMNGDKSVTASFSQITYTLTTSVVGQGSVSANPDQATYPSGSSVQLTATADPGWTFSGWGGACSGTDTTCTLTMDGNKSVTATFTQNQYTLSVITTGEGSGGVVSSPSGINCPGTCTASFASGTPVTLTATADDGSTIGAWGDDCEGTSGDSCDLTMDDDKIASVSFDLAGP